MKTNLPIWIQSLEEVINWWFKYIDKTKIISNILNWTKYYFLSRPRRFGKSLTLSTIKCIYQWKKELFKNTYIYNNWNWTKTNPVIYMSFAWYTVDQDLDEYKKEILRYI